MLIGWSIEFLSSQHQNMLKLLVLLYTIRLTIMRKLGWVRNKFQGVGWGSDRIHRHDLHPVGCAGQNPAPNILIAL
jgi:hypothetical protein